MKIQSIGSYYSQNIYKTKKVEKTDNNIQFGRFGNRYDVALAISEQEEKVKKLELNIDRLEEKQANSIFPPTQAKIDKKIRELKAEKEKLEEYRQEYATYNPMLSDFSGDVERGRQRRESLQEETYDGVDTSFWDSGASYGDWPFYTP